MTSHRTTIRIAACTALALLVAVPAFAHLAPRRIEIVNSLGMRLVRIEPGSFTMGSNAGPPERRPAHKVTIAEPFFIGATEVTQAQWVALMGFNPSRTKGPELPVTHVNYMACREFCRRLTARERALGKLPKAAEYRLPSEAEWEYACRAGSTTTYHFGDDDSMLVDHAWFKANSDMQLHETGQKLPNAWGLYDMHGNVGEWCRDLYRKYVGGSENDSRGKSSDEFRVIRGGGFGDDAIVCQSADRCRFPSERRHLSLGFRVVRTVAGDVNL